MGGVARGGRWHSRLAHDERTQRSNVPAAPREPIDRKNLLQFEFLQLDGRLQRNQAAARRRAEELLRAGRGREGVDVPCLQPGCPALAHTHTHTRAHTHTRTRAQPQTPFGKPKKTYSGKVGGRNDDLVIALQLSLSGVRVFYEEPKYASFRPVNNEHVPIPT